MPLYAKIAIVFHGDQKVLPGAEDAVKKFVDICRAYSNGMLEIYAAFVGVNFQPPKDVFVKDDKYGYIAREKDLKPVLDQHHPCAVIRIYDHQQSTDAIKKNGGLPVDWAEPALMAAAWATNPPYCAVVWDEWMKEYAKGNEPVYNVLVHEFIHMLGSMFKMVGIGNFMSSHIGVDMYDDAFRVLADNVTPVPWHKLHGLIGVQWQASQG